MAKKPTSIRLASITAEQIAALIRATGLSKTEIIALAIDRLYRTQVEK